MPWWFRGPRRHREHYDGLYHEILSEPERDRVLDDICAWVAQHAAAQAPQGSITR
jgi:alpha-beta hydrolase superfamily lysophospholipase